MRYLHFVLSLVSALSAQSIASNTEAAADCHSVSTINECKALSDSCTWEKSKCYLKRTWTQTVFGTSCDSLDLYQCEKSPDCVWKPDSSKCLSDDPWMCKAEKTPFNCELFSGCAWDDDSGCLEPYSNVCPKAGSRDVCRKLAPCRWTGKNCFAQNDLTCDDFETEEACPNNCAWDHSTERCFEPTTKNCKNAHAPSVCGDIKGCVWDEKAGCLPPVPKSCPRTKSPETCEALPCTWTGKICLPKISAQCHDYKTGTTCQKHGCGWDDESGCFDNNWSACPLAHSEKSCGPLTNCVWNDDATECLAKTKENCHRAIDVESCGRFDDSCFWTGKKCQAQTLISGCSELETPDVCIKQDCLWDNTSDTCFSQNLSCNMAPASQTGCNQLRGCVWDEIEGCLSQTLSKCSKSLHFESCVAIPGCEWIDGTCQSEAYNLAAKVAFRSKTKATEVAQSVASGVVQLTNQVMLKTKSGIDSTLSRANALVDSVYQHPLETAFTVAGTLVLNTFYRYLARYGAPLAIPAPAVAGAPLAVAPECAICLGDFAAIARIVPMPCGHTEYHPLCILGHFAANGRTCPECRAVIPGAYAP